MRALANAFPVCISLRQLCGLLIAYVHTGGAKDSNGSEGVFSLLSEATSKSGSQLLLPEMQPQTFDPSTSSEFFSRSSNNDSARENQENTDGLPNEPTESLSDKQGHTRDIATRDDGASGETTDEPRLCASSAKTTESWKNTKGQACGGGASSTASATRMDNKGASEKTTPCSVEEDGGTVRMKEVLPDKKTPSAVDMRETIWTRGAVEQVLRRLHDERTASAAGYNTPGILKRTLARRNDLR
eukprot:GHVS01076165.1.p2 GENE.GHVS01076165.1~~GHVS01076165.1.p2  ORF type:complete len:243 (-),score=29.21 GHVS01076165.1:2638-3366(-)